VCELRAQQGRHQEVETHEAAGKNGRCAKGIGALESAEKNKIVRPSSASCFSTVGSKMGNHVLAQLLNDFVRWAAALFEVQADVLDADLLSP
jgi:hypothetical protein